MGISLRKRGNEFSANEVNTESDELPVFKVTKDHDQGYITFPILTEDGNIAVKTYQFFGFQYQKMNKNTGKPYYIFRSCLAPDPETHPDLFKRCCLLTSNKDNQPRTISVTVIIASNFRMVKGTPRADRVEKPYIIKLNKDKLASLKLLTPTCNWEETDIYVTSDNPTFQAMKFTPVKTDTLWTRIGDTRDSLLLEKEVEPLLDECNDLFDIAERAVLDYEDPDQIEIFLDKMEEEMDEFENGPKHSTKQHQEDSSEDDDEDNEDINPYGASSDNEDEEELEEEEPKPAKKPSILSKYSKFKK